MRLHAGAASIDKMADTIEQLKDKLQALEAARLDAEAAGAASPYTTTRECEAGLGTRRPVVPPSRLSEGREYGPRSDVP